MNKAIFLAISLLLTFSCKSESENFKLHKFENTEKGIQLVFRNTTSMKMVVLNDESKTVFVKTSDFKGAFDWNKIKSFKNIKGIFWTEFDNRKIKFGEIPLESWEKFHARYSTQFRTEIIVNN